MLLVLVAEFGVGLGDADEGDVGVGGEVAEEALDVAVDEAYYGYFDGGVCLGRGGEGSEEEGGEEEGGEEEFSEVHATQSSPFLSTRVRSLREAPLGFFSPRSHWEIRLIERPRWRAKTA